MDEKSYVLVKAANGIDFLMSPATHAEWLEKPELAQKLEETAKAIARVESRAGTSFDRPVHLSEKPNVGFATSTNTAPRLKSYLKLSDADAEAFLGNDVSTLKSLLQVPLSALREGSARTPAELEGAIAHELGHANHRELTVSYFRLRDFRDNINSADAGDWLDEASQKLDALLDAAPRTANGNITPESLLDGMHHDEAFLNALHACRDMGSLPENQKKQTIADAPEIVTAPDARRQAMQEKLNNFINTFSYAMEFDADDVATRNDPAGAKQTNDKMMLTSANPDYDSHAHPATISRVVRAQLLDDNREASRAEGGKVDESAATAKTNAQMANVRAATEQMSTWRDRYEAEKAAKAADISPSR